MSGDHTNPKEIVLKHIKSILTDITVKTQYGKLGGDDRDIFSQKNISNYGLLNNDDIISKKLHTLSENELHTNLISLKIYMMTFGERHFHDTIIKTNCVLEMLRKSN